MKENWSVDTSETPDETDNANDNEIISLLKEMQQQMAGLERKMDLLISHSKGRQPGAKSGSDRSFRNRSYSKPFRSFDQPQHHGRGEYGHGRREGDPAQGHFYEHRPQKKDRGAGPGKKPFSRKDRE
jgi:hypothetical protein